MSSWQAIADRARSAPADVVPGLLASTVRAAGGHVGYVGPRRLATGRRPSPRTAPAASSASRSPSPRSARRARALWRETDVLVAKLAPGPPGRGQLLRAARPARRRPRARDPGPQPHHAAPGCNGGRRAGGRNDSLLRFDADRGDRQLHGRRADRARAARHRRSGRDVRRADRSAGRRDSRRAVGAAQPPHRPRPAPLGSDLARPDRGVLLAGSPGSRRGDRRAWRALLLAAMWLPSVLLRDSRACPVGAVEGLIVAGGCGCSRSSPIASGPGHGRSCCRRRSRSLYTWPTWRWAPSRAAVAAGPEPGARVAFLRRRERVEIALAAVGLLGLGRALATAPRAPGCGGSRSEARCSRSCSRGAASAPTWWGADVIAGATVAALVAAGKVTWRRRPRSCSWPRSRPCRACPARPRHRRRRPLQPVGAEAGGLDEIADIAERRVRLSYRSLGRGMIPFLVAFALVGLAVGFRCRRMLLAATDAAPGVGAGCTACWRPCSWAR